MKRLFFCLSIFFLFPTAYGATSPCWYAPMTGIQPDLTTATNAYNGTACIWILRDAAGTVDKVIYQDVEGSQNVKEFSLAELQNKPQLVKVMDGHNAVFLSLENDFSPSRGVHAIVRFLNNGDPFSTGGKYLNFRFKIEPRSQGLNFYGDPNPRDPESDGNRDTAAFNHLFFNVSRIFGRITGIHDVQPSLQ